MCQVCGKEMRRVWTSPHVSVKGGGYFDYGLGKYIGGKDDRRREMDVIRHKESEPIEIGNEIATMKKLAPKQMSYDDIPRGALERVTDAD